MRGWVITLRTTWKEREILWCSFIPKRSKIGQEIPELWPFSPWEFVWLPWEAHRTKGDPLGLNCTEKIQNRLKMAELQPFSPWEVVWLHWEAHETKGDPLVIICTKKIQFPSRIAKLRPIPPKRLWDSIEKQVGQIGIFWCSFKPKISKTGQEMASLGPVHPREVVWFHWEAHWAKGSFGVHLYQKDPVSVKKWLS